MASRVGALVFVVILVWAASSLITTAAAGNGLSATFYAKSCPQYEKIIYNYVTKLYNSPKNNTVVSMIRWAFHDFFNVSGTESILRVLAFVYRLLTEDSVDPPGR